MTEHWTTGRVKQMLKWSNSFQEMNTASYVSVGFWSIYTVTLYPDKSRIKGYYTKRPCSVVSCLFLPPRPAPLPDPLKIHWSSKLLCLSLSPCPPPRVSFCRLSSRLRWDTSAKWVSLRRRRWPPVDTSRWPPSPAPSQLRLNFSCTKQKTSSSDRHVTPNNPSRCSDEPFHEEHEFSCGICGADDPLWSQASSEAPQLLCLRVEPQNTSSARNASGQKRPHREHGNHKQATWLFIWRITNPVWLDSDEIRQPVGMYAETSDWHSYWINTVHVTQAVPQLLHYQCWMM